MQWMLGGSSARVLPAPMLLAFPSDIAATLPDDPYAAPEIREKSRVAAMAKASAVLDGSVEASEAGFRVEVRLLAKTGQEVARGEGTGAELDAAVEGGDLLYDARTILPDVRAALDALENEL